MSGAPPHPAGLPHVADLLARHFPGSARELHVGGLPVGALVARFGSPLFVYDEAILARQWDLLRGALPAAVRLCYSVKANPNQALLRWFVARGAGLEVASSGELVQALAAGCAPDAVLFAGPGKTDAELALALDRGIGEIHVESLGEGRRLARLAAARGRRARVALRVNPAAAVEGGSMRMGARAVQFGIDEDELPGVLAALRAEPALELQGLHLFIGTQILDAAVLLAQYREGVALARRLAAALGRPLATLDLGGGLGVPYVAGEARLDVAAVGAGLAGLLNEMAREPALAGTRVLMEPGRFLVAEAGVYVARVTDVKRSRGKLFAVTDGGMHHHLAASGNLGQTIRRNFPLALLTRLDEAAAGPVEVVGPLCTPLDTYGRAVPLPAVREGDLVGVFQAGAYARAASPLGFLSRPAPAEVLVREGMAHLIRRAGRDEDYLADQPSAGS